MKDLFKIKYRLIERKYPAGYVEYVIQYRCFFFWSDIGHYSYRELSRAQRIFKDLTNPPVETILETT